MKATGVVIAALLLITAGLSLNQWRLQRALQLADTIAAANSEQIAETETKLRAAEQRLSENRAQLETADQNLTRATAQIARLDQRLRQLEGGGRPPSTPEGTGVSPGPDPALEGDVTNAVKRAWGPEQATGEPDTMQAGDISTAWAPLEQDGGEEWLKLDYEGTVEIAEVRVRETHNPGAIFKLTAFLSTGSEVTLWEGIEPASQAPVEMSFTVPVSVIAKTVKLYLDTKRVPGWNEIDAVELIGRDGSHQWARHAMASSTYAQPRPTDRAARSGLMEQLVY
jgi:hypothetical protein